MSALSLPPEMDERPSGPPDSRNVLERFLRLRRLSKDVLGTMEQRFARYGDAHRGEVLGPPSYSFRHPDAVFDVLVTHASCFGKRTQNLELLGNGLLLSEGEAWRRQRRRIQPGFHHESILAYGTLIEEEAERLLGRWAPGMVIELRAAMLELTLRVVCRTLFGQSYRGDSGRLASTLTALQRIAVSPALLPPWAPSPTRIVRRYLRGLVDREVYSIIDSGASEPGSLLAELRAARDQGVGMTRTELRDEVVTLFLAGHETTALSLTWTFSLVATHPEVDAALQSELQQLCGPVATAAIDALTLFPRVLRESMRLYPPAYVLPRVCREPVRIAGVALAPGDEAWLWIFHMQRDPRWFREPARFDPERFAPDGEHALHPRAYAPFGAGSRSCIGRHFANLEALLVLAKVLERYRLEPLERGAIPVHPRVTLAPAKPVRVRLHPR